eukprot:scaffold24920_cov117-Cylindrotheca_fusiformis.AAC.1
MVQPRSTTASTGGATPQKVRIQQNHRLRSLHRVGMSQQARAMLHSPSYSRKNSLNGSVTPLGNDYVSTDTTARRRQELLLDNADRFMTGLESWRLRVNVETGDEEIDDESDFDDDTSSMNDCT